MPVLMKLSASWRVVCLSAKALHILCSFLLLAWRLSHTRMTALRCRKLCGIAPWAAADFVARRACLFASADASLACREQLLSEVLLIKVAQRLEKVKHRAEYWCYVIPEASCSAARHYQSCCLVCYAIEPESSPNAASPVAKQCSISRLLTIQVTSSIHVLETVSSQDRFRCNRNRFRTCRFSSAADILA